MTSGRMKRLWDLGEQHDWSLPCSVLSRSGLLYDPKQPETVHHYKTWTCLIYRWYTVQKSSCLYIHSSNAYLFLPGEGVNIPQEAWLLPLGYLASSSMCSSITLGAFINTFYKQGECSLQYGKGHFITSPHLPLRAKTGLSNYQATVRRTKGLL